MIETGHRRISWWWVFLLGLPMFANAMVSTSLGQALVFTLQKFVQDPRRISFLISMNVLLKFLVAPYSAWKSDRVWTRLGRRRPFLLVGWSLVALTFFLIPLASTLWQLIPCMVVCIVCEDMGHAGVWVPLYYEIVPSPQRGRASVVKRYMALASRTYLNFYLIRQFDEAYLFKLNFGFLGRMQLWVTGEQMLYWVVGSLALVIALHFLLNIRETPPKTMPDRERFNPVRYVKSLFGDPQWRTLYILQFCTLAMAAGLGALGVLLVTDQFGYSKQALGMIGVYTHIIEFTVALPLAMLILDRFDRFKIFQVCLIICTVHPISYWLFVKFLAPNHIPALWQIVCFNLGHHVAEIAAVVAMEPLLFDYVPRNKMGMISSGLIFVNGAIQFVLFNGVAWWVHFYSKLFVHLPPKMVGGKLKPQYDYMSGYLYAFVIGIIGCIMGVYFARVRKSGRLIEYGRLESEGKPAPDAPSEAIAPPKPAEDAAGGTPEKPPETPAGK